MITLICKNCGSEFSRYPSDLRAGRGVHCSVKCKGIASRVPAKLRRPRKYINSGKECSVRDCNEPASCRKMCASHYGRWSRTGSPLGGRRVRRHGMSKMREYGIWQGMNERCYNQNRREYPYYGGRGIQVCDEWRHSFLNFLRDMGQCDVERGELDRINGDGNYEPSNCRWTTRRVQVINRDMSRINSSGFRGVTLPKGKTRYVMQVGYDGVRISMHRFRSPDAAANMYDQFASQLQGDIAVLNFDYIEVPRQDGK
ncbi:hypothetical protein RhoFasB10_03317 [Rhodococcus sp. B10]|nr:hypothetical protein [Rhodococcus sp. B10]